ncbi:MAG: AAA family ATPase, partial [Bacteroidota bacterium]
MNDVPRPRDTKIITVANQKGGVGKSTNSINLAAALGERGYRCLLIDLDATSGATKALGVPTKGWVGVYELITGEEEPEGCIIDENEEEISLPRGVHFI